MSVYKNLCNKVFLIQNPEFYADLVYKFKKSIGNLNFSNLFKRIVNRFKRAGFLDIMRQTACLVFYPIIVEGYAALFICTAVVQALRLNDGFDVKLEIVG